MSKETSKCHDRRLSRGDFDKYLHGDGIDIGCGDDVLKVPDGRVLAWDWNDGDAQAMKGVVDASQDFCYSSHCLEHVRDVSIALQNWTRILKPGGFLYFVVPDYLLYEKLTWPSRYNEDHKHSFSLALDRAAVGRQNHWNILDDLVPMLADFGVHNASAALEFDGFDFNDGMKDQTRGDALSQICVIGRKKP